MLLTSAFTALSLVLVFLSGGASGVLDPLDGGFGLTCTGIHLTGSGGDVRIVATCKNKGGGTNGVQSLDLDSCLINSNGGLRCQEGGGGMDSCFNCGLSGTTLTCTCIRDNGGTDTTSIDLNNCIGNQDGLLHC